MFQLSNLVKLVVLPYNSKRFLVLQQSVLQSPLSIASPIFTHRELRSGGAQRRGRWLGRRPRPSARPLDGGRAVGPLPPPSGLSVRRPASRRHRRRGRRPATITRRVRVTPAFTTNWRKRWIEWGWVGARVPHLAKSALQFTDLKLH